MSFRLLAPLCAAGVVALGLAVLVVRGPTLSPVPHAEPAPAIAAPAPAEAPRESPVALQPPAQPPEPSASRYVVQRGDSLWKIYRSLGNDPAMPNSWAEFLSRMSAENGIDDPDRILPGKVLTVQPAQP
jgi:5'-nucleotidase / UDP-sugar diphosphatase